MDIFRKYLESARKTNGEKLLTSSIDIYVTNIERFEKRFVTKSFDTFVDSMNEILKKEGTPNIKASFKWYLRFLGIEKDDDRLKLLRKLDKRASALTSERMLGKKIIPEDDLDILIDSLEGDLKLAVMFFRDTAIRRSELLKITRKDVRFIDDSNIQAKVRIIGKGDKIREVYLRKITVETYIGLGKSELASDEKIFQFLLADGTPHKRQDKKLYDEIAKISEKVLGYKIHPHQFRHTALSTILNKSGNLAGVSKLAGHSNYSTTQIYTKHATSVARNMMRDIE